MKKHVRSQCLQRRGGNIGSDTRYAGFHSIQIACAISAGNLFNVAPPPQKNGVDKMANGVASVLSK
jgi:hypothetical protein